MVSQKYADDRRGCMACRAPLSCARAHARGTSRVGPRPVPRPSLLAGAARASGRMRALPVRLLLLLRLRPLSPASSMAHDGPACRGRS